MQRYSFWDIPSVMLACVRIIVKRKEKADIVLINADKIKTEVDNLIKNSDIKIHFVNR